MRSRMDLKLTTSLITTLRTRRKGRERFWMLSSAPAVGGGELALIVFETSRVSSVMGSKPAFERYSS
jgi:hypothetical protein